MSSWDRFGRAIDLARRKNLVGEGTSVLTEESGAVASGQLKTMVELMRQSTATTSESRSILLTLGRTAQVAPERLESFAQLGGLAALGSWLRAAAPHAQATEQRSIAVGCLRMMAKLPTSQALLRRSGVAMVVKDIAHRCPWAQKDVQALLKHWCSGVLQEQASQGSAPKAPGLVLASQIQSAPGLAIRNKKDCQQTGAQAQQSASSSAASLSLEDKAVAGGDHADPGAAAGAASSADEPAPLQSRFEPRKPQPGPEAKRRKVEDERVQPNKPSVVNDQDDEVQALLKELASLNDLLLPPD